MTAQELRRLAERLRNGDPISTEERELIATALERHAEESSEGRLRSDN